MKSKTITTILLAVMMAMASVIPSFADAVGGPKEDVKRIEARSYRDFTVSFIGGREARVALKGDGDTDLDLYVYDENGNLIASDEDNTDLCVARWQPRWTGAFRIRVVNRGAVYSVFSIATN